MLDFLGNFSTSVPFWEKGYELPRETTRRFIEEYRGSDFTTDPLLLEYRLSLEIDPFAQLKQIAQRAPYEARKVIAHEKSRLMSKYNQRYDQIMSYRYSAGRGEFSYDLLSMCHEVAYARFVNNVVKEVAIENEQLLLEFPDMPCEELVLANTHLITWAHDPQLPLSLMPHLVENITSAQLKGFIQY